MAEITKKLKIVSIVNIIIALSCVFFYLVVPYYYLSIIEWPFFDPYYSWAFGGIFLILSSFLLKSIIQNHWEKLKSVLEILIAWYLLILILNIVSLVFIPTPLTTIIILWISNLLFITLSGLTIYFIIGK
ncbi:MAG: hypothetical protein ACFE9R_14045 [Candidatus Hermodarchaeota archaeon]